MENSQKEFMVRTPGGFSKGPFEYFKKKLLESSRKKLLKDFQKELLVDSQKKLLKELLEDSRKTLLEDSWNELFCLLDFLKELLRNLKRKFPLFLVDTFREFLSMLALLFVFMLYISVIKRNMKYTLVDNVVFLLRRVIVLNFGGRPTPARVIAGVLRGVPA